ncbi:MAG: GNAT family N-acetyltransferase [Treponema sp.]|nr:GNAT family N-acetyltransferase [Treponema sp.]
MKIEFREAVAADAGVLIEIYNSAFYKDFIRYGECPAYGRSLEEMQRSILEFPKFMILCDGVAVGCISCKALERGVYEIGCLCVRPDYQGKGIGTAAVAFAKTHYVDWKKFTLITPVDKEENVLFYTKKCGFKIAATEMDGNVKVARFVLER